MFVRVMHLRCCSSEGCATTEAHAAWEQRTIKFYERNRSVVSDHLCVSMSVWFFMNAGGFPVTVWFFLRQPDWHYWPLVPHLVGVKQYTQRCNMPRRFHTLQCRSRLPSLGGNHSETKASVTSLSSISRSLGEKETNYYYYFLTTRITKNRCAHWIKHMNNELVIGVLVQL